MSKPDKIDQVIKSLKSIEDSAKNLESLSKSFNHFSKELKDIYSILEKKLESDDKSVKFQNYYKKEQETSKNDKKNIEKNS